MRCICLSLSSDVEMEANIMKPSSEQTTNESAYSVTQLDGDLRRMLTVQFKEFIHHIEDHERVASVDFRRPLRTVTWISMYDRKIA